MNRLRKIVESQKDHTANTYTDTVDHNNIEKSVIDPNYSKQNVYNQAYAVAETILSKLPVAPTNFLTYQLVEEIENGKFNDISSIDEFDNHIDEWVKRATDILRDRKILI